MHTLAQRWLNANEPGVRVETGGDSFPGYYTLETLKGGRGVSANRDAEMVAIAVADTGEGIAGEHLDQIFERFYRVDPARSRASGGTGIGLAIVRAIVEAHGGTVAAASQGPGHGATFTIRIPTQGPVSSPHGQAASRIPLADRPVMFAESAPRLHRRFTASLDALNILLPR